MQSQDEVWIQLEEHKDYLLSNYGNIKSVERIEDCGYFLRKRKEKILKLKKDQFGFVTFKIYQKLYYIHNLVAKYFLKDFNKSKLIFHKDDNFCNNKVTNLYQNNLDYYIKYGENRISLPDEKWLFVKNSNKYMVSSLGRVKISNHYFRKIINNKEYIFANKESLLKLLENRDGYLHLRLTINGIHQNSLVHRLVGEVFIDNLENKETIDHIDKNRKNNQINNLIWATRQENTRKKAQKIDNYTLRLKLRSKNTIPDYYSNIDFVLSNESWENIKELDDDYQISNYGRLKSLKRNILMRPFITFHGYLQYVIRGKHFKNHRLVAHYFVKNSSEKLIINHKDGNKLNNYFENLEWVTMKENIHHSLSLGLNKIKGEDSGMAKLTNDQVKDIRESELSILGLSKKYNISRPAIHAIKTRKTWTHI